MDKKKQTEDKCVIIKELVTPKCVLSGSIINLTITRKGTIKIKKK